MMENGIFKAGVITITRGDKVIEVPLGTDTDNLPDRHYEALCLEGETYTKEDGFVKDEGWKQ